MLSAISKGRWEKPLFATGGLLVDESLFSRPGPRSAEAVEQLARFLHPDVWDEKKLVAQK